MKKLLLLAILLMACEGQTVDYEMTCETVECFGEDDSSIYYSGSTAIKTCTWYCAQGDYVSIDFMSYEGACWEVYSTFRDRDGLCGSEYR